MLQNIKKIFKILINVLTILVFIILVLIIVAKLDMIVTGKNYFEMFGYSVFKVTTGSMNPTIKENDIILVKKDNNYVVDDIVTYKGEGAYITHRIVQLNGNLIITKGDANNTTDTAITGDLIIGKVVHTFNKLGIWQSIFTTPKIIVSIFITLMLFDLAFSYKGKDKLRDKEIKNVSKNIDYPMLKQIQGARTDNKLTDEEIDNLYKKLSEIKESNDEKVTEKFDKNEKEFLDYTIRLDLTELQKKINDKVNDK